MSHWLEKYLVDLVTSTSNMGRVSPPRVGLMRKRVRRYFYEIIVRPAQSHPIGAWYGLSIVLLRIWVFFVWLLLFHIWILTPKLGVRWIREFWTLRTELRFLEIHQQAFVKTSAYSMQLNCVCASRARTWVFWLNLLEVRGCSQCCDSLCWSLYVASWAIGHQHLKIGIVMMMIMSLMMVAPW